MKEKDCFKTTLLFGKPDRIPLTPGEPRESTLARWHQEGLPGGKDYYEALTERLGIHDKKVPHQEIELGVSFKMIPQFEEKVIEHRDGHFIVQDWMGALVEISDQYDFTYLRSPKDFVTRKWHKFPVETEADWEEMKWRYDPNSPDRFPSDFHEKCQSLKDRDDILRVSFNGPFWQLREWCGLVNLCFFLIDKPDFVKKMADFWRDFVLQTLIPILKNIDIDHFHVSEDMAYKGHSMISPAMVKEFLFPCYLAWIPEIKKSNSSPVEVAAGNDIVEYRRIYRKKMAYRGGIDKRTIAEGGKTMKEEVLRVVVPLLKEGGFIPSCDHGVPPDISWQNYIDYSRLLAKLTGWL